jgi:hypothetical protein
VKEVEVSPISPSSTAEAKKEEVKPPPPSTSIKKLGIIICVLGSIAAILFPPCSFLGTSMGWHFLFEKIETYYFGTYYYYQFIDKTALLLELILINGIGLAIYYYGKMQESRKK